MLVDFSKPRYRSPSIKKELLIKAVGLKSNQPLSVLDLTAGLGRDAYLLHCAGCQVQLIERSPAVAALLKESLQKANCDLPLLVMEAKAYLLSDPVFDVIYFDPIFPEKTKTALAKKESQFLRATVGDDLDAEEVFLLALTKAKKRVVVKRPKHAPPIANKKPDIVFAGNSVRFDVYLIPLPTSHNLPPAISHRL